MSRILLMLVVLIMLSCDIAREDSIEQVIGNEENPANTFYTVPEANLTIDPTAFESLKTVNSLIMSQVPKNGEAKFIENGFVFYRSTNSQATNDIFVISGKNNNGVIVNEEIKVKFVNSQLDLPCYAGTLGDKAKTEIEKSTEINVLSNDKTCGSIISNSLEIEIQPKNGKAEVVNQKIVYTPSKDFMGEDIFFYRIGINNKKNPVAPVEVSVSESGDCVLGMADDIINVLSYTPQTDLTLDVLQNDKICKVYQNATLKIITNPVIGILKIDKNSANNWVIYYKSDTKPTGVQTFEYGLFRTDKIFIKAKVTVNFN